MRMFPAPMLGPGGEGRSAFDQANVTGAWTLGGVLGLKIHSLSFAQEFKNCAPNGAAVEEMFKATLIADEPKTLVDEEACDSSGRHSPCPPTRVSLRQSQVTARKLGQCRSGRYGSQGRKVLATPHFAV